MKKIVDACIRYVENLEDGTEISTMDILSHLGYSLNTDEMFQIHFLIRDEMRNHDILLDNLDHAFSFEGLPFVIPFIIRKKKRNVDRKIFKELCNKYDAMLEIDVFTFYMHEGDLFEITIKNHIEKWRNEWNLYNS